MRLIRPSIEYKEAYLEMLDEWAVSEEEFVPFTLWYETSDFEAFILKNKKEEVEPSNNYVPHTTFWLLDDEDRVVATSNLRHHLNDKLRICGGHIGYGVRPAFRRRGYATKILELTLLEAKKMNISRVMVTCDRDNIGSKKTILNNGGVFEEERIYKGDPILNFWIEND